MGHGRPPKDSQQDFILVKGQESGGYTEIWFKRKADTKDTEKDLKLTVRYQLMPIFCYRRDFIEFVTLAKILSSSPVINF